MKLYDPKAGKLKIYNIHKDKKLENNDEWYTPKYAVKPILPYLKPKSRILCPFDTEESFFVQVFRTAGHKVTATHISNGQDFFEMEILKSKYDYIISNPPYGLKNEVLARLFELGIPFAMLVSDIGLFESVARFNMFRENNNFETLHLSKRVGFLRDYNQTEHAKPAPFASIYVCQNVLPRAREFEDIFRDNIVKAKFEKAQD
jgi:hypothetical protein